MLQYTKIGFLIVLLFAFSSQVYAQNNSGTITGTVVDSNEEPISDINISLEDTDLGDASDENGEFEITNVPAGTHTLVTSGVSYETNEQSISLKEDENIELTIRLSSSNNELQEVLVQQNKINPFSGKETEYLSKLPIQNIDNPQVYNTISSDLLTDQVVTNFDDALNNAPGLFKLWESTGRGDDGAGYYALRGFEIQPTMINGLPALTNGTMDPSNIDQIEIIKGPSGTLYGSSLISYGGLINVSTKEPYSYFGGNVSFKTGSFGLNRVTADVNTPIGKNEDIALRVNSAYHTENSFQDAGLNQSFFIAPSLSYQVNEDLSFLVNTEFYDSEQTNPTMLFLNRGEPLEATSIDELNYDNQQSYTSNDLTIKNPTYKFQGKMNYQLSDNWKSQTAVSRSSAKSDGYYSYLSTIGVPDGDYQRLVSDQQSTSLGTNIQQNFTGDVALGGLQNEILVGFDFFQQETINNSTGYIIFDQISLEDSDPAGIYSAAVNDALTEAPVTNSTTKQRTYSAYISDVVDISPSLSAMASLRLDYFDNEGAVSSEDDNFNQTALSPKFGLVYQPLEDQLSFFANYMNGFSNVDPRVQDDGSTKSFSPEQANQWEAGVKNELLDGRITSTLSYYDILVSNVVREDPDRANFFVQDGENYSRGFEASLNASPLPGLNLTAGYSYNDSKITKTDNPNLLDRRPESAGPQNLANFWTSYRFNAGPLQGFGLGLGGNYASENKVINRESTGTFTIPAYTVFNTSIFYDTDEYRIDFKINNMSDKEYYKGWTTVNPQQPRSVTASFSYKF